MNSIVTATVSSISFALATYLIISSKELQTWLYSKISHLNYRFFPKKYREAYLSDLRSGAIDSWPDFAKYMLLRETAFLVVFVLIFFIVHGHLLVAAGCAFMGFVLPDIKRKERCTKRFKQARAEMVSFLDIMSMMLESGIALLPALKKYNSQSGKSTLRIETGMLVADLELGITKEESFKRMRERLPISEISEWSATVLQADKTGSPLSSSFRQLAYRLRTNRLQKAEKLAYEAPVKLLGPLAAFIFPVIFIVLLGPIILRFIYGN